MIVALIHVRILILVKHRDIKTELMHIYENAKKYGIELEKPKAIQSYQLPIIIKGSYQGYQLEFLIIQLSDYTFSLRSIIPSKIKKSIDGKEDIDLAFYATIATQLIEGYAIQDLIAECGDLETYAPPALDLY